MASIHIKEIIGLLKERQDKSDPDSDMHFIEIKFDREDKNLNGFFDKEFSNKVLTAECPYGSVTIQFDDSGMLKSIDMC